LGNSIFNDVGVSMDFNKFLRLEVVHTAFKASILEKDEAFQKFLA
jgi:hypothetical protein